MPARALRASVAVAAIAIGALLLFWRIGAYPLTDADAAVYARAARTVVETGDLVVLRFDPARPGSDIDKPPLGIWATAGVFALLGPTDWAARLWHAFLGLATLAATARLAWRVGGARAAGVAAIVLLTSAQFFYQAREPMLDVPLTLCVTLTWLLLAHETNGQSWPRIWAAALVVGLGVLVKGPVALALTALPAVAHAISSGALRRQSLASFLWRASVAAAIVLLVAVPWHLAVRARLGSGFFDDYAGAVSWRFYLKPVHPPGLGLLVYPALLLASACPWTGLVVPALRFGVRRLSAPPPVRLLSWAVLWTLIFWGVSPTMISGKYLLPALPALAVVIAWWTAQDRPAGWRAAAWTTVACGALLVVGVWPLRQIDPAGLGTPAAIAVAVIAVTLLTGGALHLRGRRWGGVAVLASGAAAAWLLLVALALPQVERLYPERRLAAQINAADGPTARVIVFHSDSREAMLAFYVETPRLERADTVPDLRRALPAGSPAWVLERAAPLPADLRDRLVLISDYGHVRLWRTRASPPGPPAGVSSP